jgi:hypothetical protein
MDHPLRDHIHLEAVQPSFLCIARGFAALLNSTGGTTSGVNDERPPIVSGWIATSA